MNKDAILKSPFAYNVNPLDLSDIKEFSIWLEAMLSGPCGVWEENGITIVISQRALVDRVKGLTIIINSNEHPPPHFHIKYSGNNISLRIIDCSILAGNIGYREYQIIKHWHKFSKNKLIEIWNSSRPTDCVVGLYHE